MLQLSIARDWPQLGQSKMVEQTLVNNLTVEWLSIPANGIDAAVLSKNKAYNLERIKAVLQLERNGILQTFTTRRQREHVHATVVTLDGPRVSVCTPDWHKPPRFRRRANQAVQYHPEVMWRGLAELWQNEKSPASLSWEAYSYSWPNLKTGQASLWMAWTIGESGLWCPVLAMTIGKNRPVDYKVSSLVHQVNRRLGLQVQPDPRILDLTYTPSAVQQRLQVIKLRTLRDIDWPNPRVATKVELSSLTSIHNWLTQVPVQLSGVVCTEEHSYQDTVTDLSRSHSVVHLANGWSTLLMADKMNGAPPSSLLTGAHKYHFKRLNFTRGSNKSGSQIKLSSRAKKPGQYSLDNLMSKSPRVQLWKAWHKEGEKWYPVYKLTDLSVKALGQQVPDAEVATVMQQWPFRYMK